MSDLQVSKNVKRKRQKKQGALKEPSESNASTKIAVVSKTILPKENSVSCSNPSEEPVPVCSQQKQHVLKEVVSRDRICTNTAEQQVPMPSGQNKNETLAVQNLEAKFQNTATVPSDKSAKEHGAGNSSSGKTIVPAKSKAELKAERKALHEAQQAAKAATTVDKQKGETTDDGSSISKTKAELKAERRALQEAQRAAKAVKKVDVQPRPLVNNTTVSEATPATCKPSIHVPTKSVQKKQALPVVGSQVPRSTKKIHLFSHLPQYERNISVLQAIKENIHPAIMQLGLQYVEGIICGSNARCVALIKALIQVISDFKTPKDKEISHALNELVLDPSISFLEKCRPVSVGMKNVSKKLREEIINLDKKLTEEEVKTELTDMLRDFLKDNIEKAHEAIVNLTKDKITANDVILVYGCSYVVKQVLFAAHKTAKFRVIVVDSRPKLEGRSMFKSLVKIGIKCSYILINAISYAMQETTKVFLGAHALLANGYVMSRVGSSQIALVAKAYNKPVLVCCETYKFCELVQTDSVVVNELGNPDDLVITRSPTNPLEGWKDIPNLNILNLCYDVTPPDLITVVVTDVCLVPCTSVPVLLRVRPTKK